ncbi:MAG TPA: hypothetical protein VFU07_07055 [Candidatus Lumbricidophila sp.]|nr:hypothetical protein [Candidatus Lumbricidophila sp.]
MNKVPEIWYQGQRVLRTIVAVYIPALFVFNAALPQLIVALGGVLPPSAIAWLNLFAVAVAAVAGTISKIMAIPIVNSWLTTIGLGSVPRKSPEAQLTPDEREADANAGR